MNQKAEVFLEIRLNNVENDEGSRSAYETIYQETTIALRESFYLWLMELFALRTDDIYLDISCGHGQLTTLAEKKGIQAHGLDLSFWALKRGQEKSSTHRVVVGNSQRLPYASHSFTAVSNIGSIEHYSDMKTAVQEMVRILKPGGRAFVLLPNTFCLVHNIWTAFRQGYTHRDNQPIQRYAARLEWQQLLEDNGLKVERTVKYEIEPPRTWQDFWSYLRHPSRMIRLICTPLIPLNLVCCFLFFCHKP